MRFFVLTLIVMAFTAQASAQVKKRQPPPRKLAFAESRQAIVVTTPSWTSRTGMAQLFERESTRGEWTGRKILFPVVVGRNGLAWAHDVAPKAITELKKEGDGKSPAGLFPLTFSFGTSDKTSALKVPFRKLDQFTECVDDVSSTHYNKVVGRLEVGIFDWKSSEKMLQILPEYDLGVFVAHNSFPVVRGNGSCIFLHIWKNKDTPTAGCTATDRAILETIILWLDPSKNPYLIQMPEAEYVKYQRPWKLPKRK